MSQQCQQQHFSCIIIHVEKPTIAFHSFILFDVWHACIAQIKFKRIKLTFLSVLEIHGQSSVIKLFTKLWLIASEFNGALAMFTPILHLIVSRHFSIWISENFQKACLFVPKAQYHERCVKLNIFIGISWKFIQAKKLNTHKQPMCGQNGLCKTISLGQANEKKRNSLLRDSHVVTDVNIYTFRKLLTIIVSFAKQTEFAKHIEETARNVNIRWILSIALWLNHLVSGDLRFYCHLYGLLCVCANVLSFLNF